jgi:RimJ/RimL family protein N-acetyltransferase
MLSALFDAPPTLSGRRVRMEPFNRDRHEEGLRAAGADPAVWTWMPRRFDSRDRFTEWLDGAQRAMDTRSDFVFITVDADTGRVLGSSRYLAIRPEHRGLEIGWTWLESGSWGSGANVEAKLLMLEHAFGPLGCIRVEFKTDERNERSRAALAALPAQFEGVFRKHMLVREGELRNSAWYSITDDEWPDVRRSLERRLGR